MQQPPNNGYPQQYPQQSNDQPSNDEPGNEISKDVPLPPDARPPWEPQPMPHYEQGYVSAPMPPPQPQPQWYPPQQPSPQQQWQQPYQPSFVPPQPMQQQFAPPYPGQMPYPQQAPFMQPPVQVQNIVQVNINQKSPSFLVRALYYVFIGSWLGFFWLNLGYFLCFTVILLPAGLVMLNRLPMVLTLRPGSQQVNITTMGNVTNITIGGASQYSFLIRALYFVFIGSWLGYLWATLGYMLCLSIVLMPVGLIMLNRLPGIITLRKN